MVIEYALPDINNAAQQLWGAAKNYRIWALHGQMGNGKTTLVHALCETLQVTDTISSPTFAIINEYRSPVAGTIYHMDWYRMKDEEEAIQAGIDDCLQSGNYCFVEWPEKAVGLLPDETLHLQLDLLNNQTRQIRLML
ncbi:tRNA (adenosine(37)-N6)-threonylcarbamoyltransferase complex ATPase subunit type 1 TsaE [Foetidibacter luteolus]|uniref:tRNA (adenosine(37)-N6)-threonylcarbamoyltransferase complex ATPase subunit type 1 TsaE n=1 Tax=Foetidibacter luteolus TaxID=2608880 RepID=UPI00129ADD4C|nr:tRNA (adenosine(37)-N6)-threonylcarbamoyltransferase complex ATPase subunit type 1 TsaE [Foetidibacter luteolus]